MTGRFWTFILLLFLGLSAVTVLGQNVPKTPLIPVDEEDALDAVLTVNPKEIDLGALGPGEEAKGTFYLKNAGSGNPEWFANGDNTQYIRVEDHDGRKECVLMDA